MYKRIDFTKLEGIATYQDTLDFLQTSYREAISAIAKAFGSRVIVTGVTDQGVTYSDGWIIIDGELMPFAGGLKTDRIITETLSDTEIFGDGSTHTVYYTKIAKLGVTGGYAFNEFIRVDTMAGISQGLKSLITAHNNLQTAHNSLQTAFNTHTHSWHQLTDKPSTFTPSGHGHDWSEISGTPNLVTYLHKGSEWIGDVNHNSDKLVFVDTPYMGTANYMVLGSMVSESSNWDVDNDVVWGVAGKSAHHFYIGVKVLHTALQNLRFDYILIPF